MGFPLTSLPHEVLEIVFSYLGVKDRLQACLVCKKWLELINCRSLLCDIKVNIKRSTFEDYSYPCMTRNFLTFELLEMSTDDNWRNGLNYISPCVEYLSMDTYESYRFVFSFDKTFQNLRELKVLSFNKWHVFPSCPKLLSLSVYLSTLTVNTAILKKTMKHLKTLNLLDHPDVTYPEYLSSMVLSGLNSFVSERIFTLSQIDIKVYALPVSVLKELLCMKGLSLTNLYLSNRQFISPDISKFLIGVFSHHRNLKTLNLYGFNLNDNVGNAIYWIPPSIQSIVVSCDINDEFLKGVFELKKLKKLIISECTGYSLCGCREAIAGFKSSQIEHITLDNFIIPKDSASFFKQLTNVVKLNLTRCFVTDSHVHIISTYLVNLEELVLRGNDGISDDGLTAVKNLEENQDSTSGHKALCNLKRLRKLDLSSCTKLTDGGIIAAVRFPSLRTLILYGLNLAENTYSVLLSQNPLIQHIERDWSGYDPFSF